MRIMAIDYGDAHTGVAISDPTGMLAGWTTTIDSRKQDVVVEQLRAIIAEWQVTELVLGYPKNMNDTEGERVQKTLAFKEALERRTGLEVVLWDERMSTVASERVLMEGNVRREDRKTYIDKMAAAFILQGYLDYQSFSAQQKESED